MLIDAVKCLQNPCSWQCSLNCRWLWKVTLAHNSWISLHCWATWSPNLPGCTNDLEKYRQLKLRMPDLPLGYSIAFPLISIPLANSEGHFAFQHAWTTPWRAMLGALESFWQLTEQRGGEQGQDVTDALRYVFINNQGNSLERDWVLTGFQRSDSSRDKTGHLVLILLELTDCHYNLISILNVIHYDEYSLTDEQTFCRICQQ